jgi:bacteriorhodopsin
MQWRGERGIYRPWFVEWLITCPIIIGALDLLQIKMTPIQEFVLVPACWLAALTIGWIVPPTKPGPY